MKLNRYIWTFEEIKKFAIILLDKLKVQLEKPLSLIAIRVTECTDVNKIRKDKSIGEFTKKLTEDERRK